MPKTLEDRIGDVADDSIGVLTALLDSRQRLGDDIITRFLDRIPEKGGQLWLRFKRFKAGENGGKEFMNFSHFIISVVMSKQEVDEKLKALGL